VALGITNRSAVTNQATASQTLASGSYTPSADAWVFKAGAASNNFHTTVQAWTVTDTVSSVWTQQALSNQADYAGAGPNQGLRIGLFKTTTAGSPAARVATLDPYTAAQLAMISTIDFDVTGTSLTVVQESTAEAHTEGGGNTESMTTGALPGAATNGNLVVMVIGGADSGPPTTPSGWTLLASAGTAGAWSNVAVFYRTDFTGVDVAITDLGSDIGVAGSYLIEIAEGGGPPPANPKLRGVIRSGLTWR